jgi:hypothetical protein
MGYPSIPLDEEAQNILTIITPFGAYECLTLPMGVMPASDIFQARMVDLFANMGKNRPYPYINDILHFKGDTFEEHIEILCEILKLLTKMGMQISVEKSRFCQASLEYLGFELNRTGYRPLPSQIDAILRIQSPKNVKQVRGFLGTINFIKNHIIGQAEICKPITGLTQKNVKFVWGEEQEAAMQKIKAKIAESIMLEYPNPNRPFDIYPDARSKYAIGAMLMQNGKIVSTFSRKLNEAQLKYTVTGQELLACVEVCKHFGQIIQGCEINIYTDHQNLTHEQTQHTNLHEQQARIFLDAEYQPKFIHIKGTDNMGADGLSRLPMMDNVPQASMQSLMSLNNLDHSNDDFLIDMQCIAREQEKDAKIQRLIKEKKHEKVIGSNMVDGVCVITFHGKVWVPENLQERLVEWYHNVLQHARKNRMINTISQTFAWKGLTTSVENHVDTCNSCQRNKHTNKKAYGKVPLVPALRNKEPWQTVHVDCGGPWTVRYFDDKTGQIPPFEVTGVKLLELQLHHPSPQPKPSISNG